MPVLKKLEKPSSVKSVVGVAEIKLAPETVKEIKPSYLKRDLKLLRRIVRVFPKGAKYVNHAMSIQHIKDKCEVSDEENVTIVVWALRRRKLLDSCQKEGDKPGTKVWCYYPTREGVKIAESLPDKLALNTPQIAGLKQKVVGHVNTIDNMKRSIQEVKLERFRSEHETGLVLRQLKGLIPSKVWMLWFKENIQRISLRQAERLMEYSKSTFTSNLKEESDRRRIIWNNDRDKNGNSTGTNGAGDSGSGKGRGKGGKGGKGNGQEVEVLKVFVPKREVKRWGDIVKTACKKFGVDVASQAVFLMANDWMARIGTVEVSDV